VSVRRRPRVSAAIVDAGFAGLQLRVNDQRGEWVGSAGVQKLGEVSPPSTDGSFWVGSVTKTFTASITMGDSDADPARLFPAALATLLNEVFKA
jgi:hypothetical protein